MSDRDNIDFWGVNMRMQPLQAIVASEGLKNIDNIIRKRNINANILDHHLSNLKPNVIIPNRLNNYKETFALYMIICKKRNMLSKFLNKNGIETKIHYPKPLHLQKAAKKFKYKKGNFPVSEYQSKNLLTLPVHQYLNKNQILYIIKKIKEFYNYG